MARRNATRRTAVLAGFAVAAVVASGCARLGTGASPTELVSASPSEAGTEAPLPVAEGVTVLAVLDPEVVKPKVSAEQAIALVRGSMGSSVGASPRVQLVRLGFRDGQGSVFGTEWTGWMILSTDIPWTGGGGPYPGAPPSHAATYTWAHVGLDGETLDVIQVGYETIESIPTLAPE